MDNDKTIFTILEKIPLFKDLTEESGQLISNNITLEYFPAHHLVFNKGDVGDAMYIIKKGTVKIFQGDSEDPDEHVVLAELTDNDFFGEMALVSENTRNASAMTLVESEVFVLKKDDFYKLIEENPSLAEQISAEFIQRIKENMRNTKFEE